MSIATSETKYVVMNHGVRKGVWIQKFLNKLFPELDISRIEMLSDNKISLTLTKNPES